MTKKTVKGVLAVLAMSLGASAQAAVGNPVDITVTVTIQKLQISASNRDTGLDTIGFGTILAGANTVNASPVSVTNSGNVTETYSLSIPSEPNATWTSVATGSPVAEQYKLSGAFRTTAAGTPTTGDFDDNDAFAVGTPKTADGANVTAVNGDSGGAGTKGFTMAVNSNQWLWLKFHAPSTTAITSAQSITMRITAATP